MNYPEVQIVQFRNKLVHYYEAIDPEIVFDIATNKTDDVREFIRQLERWMKPKSEHSH